MCHVTGAKQITLEGVYHSPLGALQPSPDGLNMGRPWYGSPGVVDLWVAEVTRDASELAGTSKLTKPPRPPVPPAPTPGALGTPWGKGRGSPGSKGGGALVHSPSASSSPSLLPVTTEPVVLLGVPCELGRLLLVPPVAQLQSDVLLPLLHMNHYLCTAPSFTAKQRTKILLF